jgi:hypothetical protein
MHHTAQENEMKARKFRVGYAAAETGTMMK